MISWPTLNAVLSPYAKMGKRTATNRIAKRIFKTLSQAVQGTNGATS
jgi:hypothetical protein